MTEDEKLELEARLENWARWSKERKPKAHSSLCDVIRVLRLKYGYPEEEAEYKQEYPAPVNYLDALRVEVALSKFPRKQYAETQAWRLLIDLYTHPSTPMGKRCHMHKIRPRQFDDIVNRGKTILYNILKKVDLRYTDKV